jgi:solute carrier family 35 protein C2
MAKSSSLLFVLLFAFLFHVERYSHRLLGVVSLITFGVFLMVFNSTSVSIPGLVMVFSASALAGLRWALTELVMRKSTMGLSNPFATIFWLAPIMAVCIGLVSMVVEGWFTVLSSDHFQGGQAIATVVVIIIPGGLAFSMVASEYL